MRGSDAIQPQNDPGETYLDLLLADGTKARTRIDAPSGPLDGSFDGGGEPIWLVDDQDHVRLDITEPGGHRDLGDAPTELLAELPGLCADALEEGHEEHGGAWKDCDAAVLDAGMRRNMLAVTLRARRGEREGAMEELADFVNYALMRIDRGAGE